MLMEETNETEVLSDMTLVGQDIVAQLRYPKAIWDIGDTAPLTYFTESDPDYLAGVKIDITME
jgi:poly-beta-hydroxyalkanoate depolymerase